MDSTSNVRAVRHLLSTAAHQLFAATLIFALFSALSCGELPDGASDDGVSFARDAYPSCYGKSEGELLENLTFVNTVGDPFSLNDIYEDPSNKVLLVTTSAGWCTACIEEQPVLQELHETYGGDGLAVLVTLFEDRNFAVATAELAKEWKENFKLSFNVVADPDFLFESYYDASLTPMTMLVDLDTMEIIRISTGFDRSSVEAIIKSRL